MREPADLNRIRRFMRALGEEARADARVYFTGGATAVLHGWRASTIDVDVKMVPESDELFRAIPAKERLQLNVELASPDNFIPVRTDWEERSPFISSPAKGASPFITSICARRRWRRSNAATRRTSTTCASSFGEG